MSFEFEKYVGKGRLPEIILKWRWWEGIFKRYGLWPLGQYYTVSQENPLVLSYTHGYVSLSKRVISIGCYKRKFSFPRSWLFLPRYRGVKVGTNLLWVGAGLVLLTYQQEVKKVWCKVAQEVHHFYECLEWRPSGMRRIKTKYS